MTVIAQVRAVSKLRAESSMGRYGHWKFKSPRDPAADAPSAARARRLLEARSARCQDVAKLEELPDRERVVATWKTLQIEIGNLKNGLKTRDELSVLSDNDRFVKIDTDTATSADERAKCKIIRYANNGVATALVDPKRRHISFGAERLSSRARAARRRTLLQRLLSWRTRDCDCRCPPLQPQPPPPPRTEDLLCTCAPPLPPRSAPLAERGRSKSVGYESTQEIQPFRRCASAGACVAGATADGSGAAALRARAALTLARRYYPEGGWGWAVSVVGTLVQVLAHGLQLGGGVGAIACTAAHRYRVPPLYTHGK
ncbi:hypothetical protein EVAR_55908_1 [Eumeta japonica]|uniref:Uncharacterized protein n=1 Tax=Eumeta variegata TaxID=151549 RepID=A0A4C1YI05_EUMVA|nr:hypothetical protein EVAR_55908_1 [Eumeta japonica]